MSDPSRPNDSHPLNDEPGSTFDTDEIRTIRVSPPATSVPSPTPATGDGYDLIGGPPVNDDELPAPVPIPIPIPPRPAERPKSNPRPKPKLEFERPDPEGSSEFEEEDPAEIHEVWSRWGEWGPDLIRIGTVGLVTLFLAWLVSSSLGTSFLVLMLGGAAMVVLSYPILITLERPVRITPEQAVTDFFGAASHHLPHYKRMWLLLSDQGRQSGRFASFEAFRDHWKRRIDGWRLSQGVSKFTPLKFEVEGFRADKSAGKETSKAHYTVNVYVRDREAGGPIESFRMIHSLAKGPDRMWYLNRAILDNRSF